MKGDGIAERLLGFAAEALRRIAELPKDTVGKHVSRQLARSATSGGANYEEARGAGSRADFVHKINIAAKEVRESVYWLKLMQRMGYARSQRLRTLIREGNELVAILKSSANTARARQAG